MNNLLVCQSGGTTQVIGSTLHGILDENNYYKIFDKIYGGFPGIEGFLKDSLKDLTNINLNQMKIIGTMPGSSYIGTTRISKQQINDNLHLLQKQFEKYNIKYFINIGGNGTLQQTMEIAKLNPTVKCAAAAKTIDNDLGDKDFINSYFTPGYPSVINYWIYKTLMLNNENLGAYSHNKVIIGQTYGRETGFIAAASRLADKDRKLPLILLLPEDSISNGNNTILMDKIENTLAKFGRAIIIVSEGYKVTNFYKDYDASGQINYGCSESTVSQEIVNLCTKYKISARLFNPTIDQRQDTRYRIVNDLFVADKIGRNIVLNFDKNKKSFFSTINKDNKLNTIKFFNTNNFTRRMKSSWISKGNFDITNECINYLSSVLNYNLKEK